jgi:hypothetical protein
MRGSLYPKILAK